MGAYFVFVFLVVVIVVAVFMMSRRGGTKLPSNEINPDQSRIISLAIGEEPSARKPAEPFRPAVKPSEVNTSISTLLPQHFIVFDLETTGLSSQQHEIIEFGAIRIDLSVNDHTTFRTLVRPAKKVPRKITEITGITQAMVEKDGLPLEDALLQFIEFIGDLPLVAFNAEFDMGFLSRAARKHGIVMNNRYTCALKRARRAWPGLSSYRLADLARLGKLSDRDTHRALGDCVRTMHIFVAATSQLGQKVRWSKPAIVPTPLPVAANRSV